MTFETNALPFDPETREWAVRKASLEMQDGDPAHALASVARLAGCTPATLRRWMRDARRAGGIRPGVFTKRDQGSAGRQLHAAPNSAASARFAEISVASFAEPSDAFEVGTIERDREPEPAAAAPRPSHDGAPLERPTL